MFGIPQEVISTIGSILIGLLIALVTYGIKWAHAKSAEMDMKTVQWEMMTKQALEASQRAADNTMETNNLVRQNTQITQQAAQKTSGAIKDFREATEKAIAFRQQIRDRISLSASSQLTDDLDDMINKYTDSDKTSERK